MRWLHHCDFVLQAGNFRRLLGIRSSRLPTPRPHWTHRESRLRVREMTSLADQNKRGIAALYYARESPCIHIRFVNLEHTRALGVDSRHKNRCT